jgi:periodic tryptophan protein 1
VWQLQAHDDTITSFDVNPIIPGFLATGSSDKQVKIWNVRPDLGPSMVVTRDLDVGRVFSTSFAPDKQVGFRLAVAGAKGNLQIWDTSTNKAVREAFAHRVAPDQMGKQETEVQERLVGLAMDDEESDDDEEEDDEEGGVGGSGAGSDEEEEED